MATLFDFLVAYVAFIVLSNRPGSLLRLDCIVHVERAFFLAVCAFGL